MANFEDLYNQVIKKSLVEKFGYTNPHEIPKLTKIVLNIGVGDAVADKKKLNNAVEELALIAGQKPVVTTARKSIATFKLREGMPIGCKVTLRSTKMYEFLERLINMALPRVRDFHGITGKNFDGRQKSFAVGNSNIVFARIQAAVKLFIEYDHRQFVVTVFYHRTGLTVFSGNYIVWRHNAPAVGVRVKSGICA